MSRVKDFNNKVEVVSESTRRIRFKVNQVDLSDLDRETLCFCFAIQGMMVYDLDLPDPEYSFHQYNRWLRGLKVLELSEFGTFTKEVGVLLRKYPEGTLTSHGILDRQGFKHLVTAKPYWGFFSPVSSCLDQFLDNQGAVQLRQLLQWTDFLKKVHLSSADFSEKNISGYLATEKRLEGISYDPALIDEISSIWREWFGYTRLLEITPKHGPGSVVGLCRNSGIIEKYAAMQDDLLLRHAFSDGPTDYDASYPIPIRFESDPDWRTCDIVFVPKTMTGDRVISKEPASLQYWQQGLRDAIREFIADHKYLRSVISFTDQSLSQSLALSGSESGDYATIDLSEASDSVTVTLVKLLARRTWLLRPLISTRSRKCRLPDGSELLMQKFAPMGSGVCFDIECIVFASICEACRRRTSSKTKFRVFGDDLIVPTDYAMEVISMLSQLGFRVNTDKSFWVPTLWNFREACGIEAYAGYDITPARVSRGFTFTSGSPSGGQWEAFVGLINRLHDISLLSCRRAAIFIARQNNHYDRLWRRTYVDDQGGQYGIAGQPGWVDNFHLSWRRMVPGKTGDYHCAEYRGVTWPEFTDQRICPEEGQIALFEWLRRAESNPDRTEPVQIRRSELYRTRRSSIARSVWRVDPKR